MGSFAWQNLFDSVFLVIRNVVFESRDRFRFATSYNLKRGKGFFAWNAIMVIIEFVVIRHREITEAMNRDRHVYLLTCETRNLLKCTRYENLYFVYASLVCVTNRLRPENFSKKKKITLFLTLKTCQFRLEMGLFERKRT